MKKPELAKFREHLKSVLNDVEKVLLDLYPETETKTRMAMVILQNMYYQELDRFEIPFDKIKNMSIIKVYDHDYYDGTDNTVKLYLFLSNNGYAFVYVQSNQLVTSVKEIKSRTVK